MDGADWQRILASAAIREEQRGTRWRTNCLIHQDSTPSMDLFADGRYKCYGCGDHGSYIDLLVYQDIRRKLSPREYPNDQEMREAYRRAFTLAREYGIDTGSYGTSRLERPRREFTEIEKAFLQACLEQVFRPALRGDLGAQAYLAKRNVTTIPDCIGVCRPNHWAAVSAVARQFNDRTLIDAVGFESHKKPGTLMIGHMLLVFNFHDGKINYYQGRRVQYDDRWRYYNPPTITKRPIVIGATSSPLKIGAEGIYKTLWLVERGWTTVTMMDNNPEQWSIPQIAQLKGGLYAQDHDDNGAGAKAGTAIRRISWAENLNIAVITQPRHKDLDDWASATGASLAERHLRSLYRYR